MLHNTDEQSIKPHKHMDGSKMHITKENKSFSKATYIFNTYSII